MQGTFGIERIRRTKPNERSEAFPSWKDRKRSIERKRNRSVKRDY